MLVPFQMNRRCVVTRPQWPGWIPVPGVNRYNWTVFPAHRLVLDAAHEHAVVRLKAPWCLACLNNLVIFFIKLLM